MSIEDTGQVVPSAAEVYESFFVPALFEQWADRVAAAAEIQPGDRVLDVACGTGVLARAVAGRVGRTGEVVGIDVNDGMLAVARRSAPSITWTHAPAEALPFEADRFDAVVSQFGLMFFMDRRAALREMQRVVRPGGRIAVAVWDALESSPGYAAMAALVERLFGEDVARALHSPFALGNRADLQSLFAQAGIPRADVNTSDGTARFPSVKAWVYTEIKGWTLAEVLDDDQFERLLREAEHELGEFVQADGTVAFRISAHIVTASKA